MDYQPAWLQRQRTEENHEVDEHGKLPSGAKLESTAACIVVANFMIVKAVVDPKLGAVLASSKFHEACPRLQGLKGQER